MSDFWDTYDHLGDLHDEVAGQIDAWDDQHTVTRFAMTADDWGQAKAISQEKADRFRGIAERWADPTFGRSWS